MARTEGSVVIASPAHNFATSHFQGGAFFMGGTASVPSHYPFGSIYKENSGTATEAVPPLLDGLYAIELETLAASWTDHPKKSLPKPVR
jgi:hypothetical protein